MDDILGCGKRQRKTGQRLAVNKTRREGRNQRKARALYPGGKDPCARKNPQRGEKVARVSPVLLGASSRPRRSSGCSRRWSFSVWPRSKPRCEESHPEGKETSLRPLPNQCRQRPLPRRRRRNRTGGRQMLCVSTTSSPKRPPRARTREACKAPPLSPSRAAERETRREETSLLAGGKGKGGKSG